MRTGISSRVGGFIAANVVLMVVVAGGGILIATQTADFTGWVVAASASFSSAAVAPIILGAWLAYWDPDRSDAARRITRRMLLVVIGVEVVASVILVWSLAMSDAPPWVAVVLVLAVITATFLAVHVGVLVRRRSADGDDPSLPEDYPREAASRDLRRISLVTAITFVLAFAALVTLVAVSDLPFGYAIAYAFVAAALAVSLMCNLVVVRLSRAQRSMFDGDAGRVRAIGKLVLGRKRDVGTASEDDLALAARYAATLWVTLSYQTAGFVALYLSLILGQLVLVVSNGSVLSMIIAAALAILAAVIFPIMGIQTRRARRFAQEHPAHA